MVSRGYRKRACGVVLVKKVKNPIKLAREMLVRGETDGTGGGNGGGSDPSGGSGGAQGHSCLGGETVERLAEGWGLEMVDENYFWTKKRWDEHRKGLKAEIDVSQGTIKDRWLYRPLEALHIVMAILKALGRQATLKQITEFCESSSTSSYIVGPVLETCSSMLVWEMVSYKRKKNCYCFKTGGKATDPLDPNGCWTINPDVEEYLIEKLSKEWEWHVDDAERRGPHTRKPIFDLSDDGWDGKEYLPQGTVGCVALDHDGTLCVATSTGGLTNKLPCRIGDTPTIGAGFWAEEWDEAPLQKNPKSARIPQSSTRFLRDLRNLLGDCIPNPHGYRRFDDSPQLISEKSQPFHNKRAVAMSGTGNGDSFLRLAAVRTAGAIVRFSPDRSLASAVNQVAGPFGELQRSAGDRWGRTGEGEGGIIGIELVDGNGEVVFDFNCGGMFRCWMDDKGVERVMVFRDEY